ncbi:hypothetical protein CK203_042071 [Vitis vinifera]|uniref:Uncharacterized protein n=1 Tax=Vitis vinifera TaxID=29760 RepID=A0A438HHL6_VITVI|nr:hypothetical protein CK203_042071 [Vitis vinifera]
MKAKIAAMARRLEELEMKKMQEMQAISQTPLQAMPWAICLSYEHLVEECPTIPVVREMFGDCNTYNSNWRDHPNFSWKPQPPQYQQPAQAPQQASNLEQAIVNLSKKLWPFEDDCAKLNRNIAAAPHFATVGHVYGVLPGAQIMHMIFCFEYWEVRNPELQAVHDLDLKQRSYGHLKTDCAKLSENFAP